MAAPLISPEATNYARLCLAIRTTCADCLGDLLQNNLPPGYGDIYQAVLAKRSQLFKQLTKDQFSTLFPSHLKQPPFLVADCDTPLLYSLIRNVSSVQSPLSGWGSPVNQGDTSLGANVERLRCYRNTIIHFKKPMVSSNEFNTIWAEVRQCISNIEAVLGGVQHQQSLDSLKTADMDPDYVNREIAEVGRLLRHIEDTQNLQGECLDSIRDTQNLQGECLDSITDKQNMQEECLDEIRKDQVAHGTILDAIERTQNEHGDSLNTAFSEITSSLKCHNTILNDLKEMKDKDVQDVRKAQQDQDEVLGQIKTSQSRQEDSLNDFRSVQKDQIAVLGKIKETQDLTLERIENKVDKLLYVQAKGNTLKRRMIDVPEEVKQEEEGEKQNIQSPMLHGIQGTNESKRQCLEKETAIKTLAGQSQIQRQNAHIDTYQDSSATGNSNQHDITDSVETELSYDDLEAVAVVAENDVTSSVSKPVGLDLIPTCDYRGEPCSESAVSDMKSPSLDQLSSLKMRQSGSSIQYVGNKDKNATRKLLTDKDIDESQVTGENVPEDMEMKESAFSLREYQKELARPAIDGKNVIIVSPTGSGKTIVALEVIKQHMELKRGREIPKVIFLVNQVPLANQQGETLKELLPEYQTKVISGDIQRSLNISLKNFIDKRNILVVTAQVLLDALVKKEIQNITQFSLMIFDECHHCHAKHPFNQIMSFYMDIKLSDSYDKTPLPQILGLTASVGVGKSRDIEKAKEHIKKLMANLDAHEISTVKNNLGELKDYVNVPSEETRSVEKRKSDEFGEAITQVMNKIEERMMQCELLKTLDNLEQYKAVLKAPVKKGSDKYTQWVSTLRRETNRQIRDASVRSFFNHSRNHLEIYNDTLIIYNDAPTRDAVDQLKSKMSEWKQSTNMKSKNEQELQELFEKITETDFVERIQEIPNPKLEILRHTIIESFNGKPDEESRGIIFVKTRHLAKLITAWIKETPDLKHLNPTEFVGRNTSGGNNAMTKAEQVDTLKWFRDGRHKLIVATSAAEEGLDISKCNLVIRYDHVTNEISMVQSRGRARAQDSRYVLLAQEDKGMDEKAQFNMIREIMMQKALSQLQEEIAINPIKFNEELKNYQKTEQLNRRLEAHRRKGRLIRTGEFDLRCIGCEEYICMSSDVKTVQDVHHVVVLDDFEERVSITKTEERTDLRDIQFCGKLNCKKCKRQLGHVCIYRNLELPVIKISSFFIVDTNDRQDTCNKWNKAPFQTLPLTDEDIKMLLDKKEDNNFN